MIGSIPKRPTGTDPEAIFMQWVYDNLVSFLQSQEVSGQQGGRTTRGRYTLPNFKQLPLKELKVCEADGSEDTWIFFAYKKTKPAEITADRTDITADSTEITADQ